ncbi:hypothetical protein BDZ91DRAFT_714767 [Kalaharituber pfeilii]|nr:hypothetical protein BDZ91DRAFT_714767 [Kalaharituber pfeilii]
MWVGLGRYMYIFVYLYNGYTINGQAFCMASARHGIHLLFFFSFFPPKTRYRGAS